ncbi:hypothetical protein H3H36_07480 [Duganella sp. FT3S]|uniref:Uncharacterized protein n=1 Tax=Rugamonas fusca TaxID=2758568 RepID=A0A7W2EFU8_9BURK|nr:hypothetical protein [Rugamonas fusca]MBA5605199.1 hypothetical protein [Rugamonas fusca]
MSSTGSILSRLATAAALVMVKLALSPGVSFARAVTACTGMAVGRLRGAARFVVGSTNVVLAVAASTFATLVAMVRSVQTLGVAALFVIPEKFRHSTTKIFSFLCKTNSIFLPRGLTPNFSDDSSVHDLMLGRLCAGPAERGGPQQQMHPQRRHDP